MTEPTEAENPLWLRYVDWCSARVARRFLELSPEEVWERAQARVATTAGAPLSYREQIDVLALDLFRDLGLPDFSVWERHYLADPRGYERDLLGFADAGTVHDGAGA